MDPKGRLLFFCGKMASGKSTLAKQLANRHGAVLLAQDEFLVQLFPGEVVDVATYLKCSTRIQKALTPHLCSLLTMGLTVVLDFPGNTRTQRAWFREVIERSGASHELHFIDVSDEVCKRQLRERSTGYPAGTRWTTDAEFDAITAYFEAPGVDEGFDVVRHERGAGGLGI